MIAITYPLIFVVFGMWIIDVNKVSRKNILSKKSLIKPFNIKIENFNMLSRAQSWQIIFILIIGIYVFFNFMFSISALTKGTPATIDGRYFQNNHGHYTEVNYDEFMKAKQAETKLFTGHPLVFLGLPLVYYGQLVSDNKKKSL